VGDDHRIGGGKLRPEGAEDRVLARDPGLSGRQALLAAVDALPELLLQVRIPHQLQGRLVASDRPGRQGRQRRTEVGEPLLGLEEVVAGPRQ
jgi:hypothetical protein